MSQHPDADKKPQASVPTVDPVLAGLDLDDEGEGGGERLVLDRKVRIVLAVLVVIISAFLVRWIMV